MKTDDEINKEIAIEIQETLDFYDYCPYIDENQPTPKCIMGHDYESADDCEWGYLNKERCRYNTDYDD